MKIHEMPVNATLEALSDTEMREALAEQARGLPLHRVTLIDVTEEGGLSARVSRERVSDDSYTVRVLVAADFPPERAAALLRGIADDLERHPERFSHHSPAAEMPL